MNFLEVKFKKHGLNDFQDKKALICPKKHVFNCWQALGKSKTVNFTFCKLKRLNSIFSSFKKLKKHGSNFFCKLKKAKNTSLKSGPLILKLRSQTGNIVWFQLANFRYLQFELGKSGNLENKASLILTADLAPIVLMYYRKSDTLTVKRIPELNTI